MREKQWQYQNNNGKKIGKEKTKKRGNG